MSTFTLAISCLTTSIMDLTFQFLHNIALYSIGFCFYHQSHPQLGGVFALSPSLHSSGVISPLISSSIFDTYWPEEFIFECPIFLPFHTVHGVLKARTEVVCHSLLQWTTFYQNSPPMTIHLGDDRMISVHLQGKPFNITVIQVYALTSNAEEAEVKRFY